MKRPFPVFCRDCAYSKQDDDSSWNLKCHNPKVNSKDSWALGSPNGVRGTSCNTERQGVSFLSPCGMKGKLWEIKPNKEAA